MSGLTSVGTTLAVTATAPQTYDKTGFAALTFTPIANVESIPAFGADIGTTAFTPLETGVTESHKGAVNYGTIAPPLAVDKTDAGQTLLRTAAAPGNNALYYFLVTYPNGDKRYFAARVFGMPETVGGASNILMATPKIVICKKIIEDNVA